ncbi:hypothetical protein TL16_g02062 [Triparma laevis f. inornata]|uniref:Cyclic nucleotide-binding domain-containing protein n=1 Tax=Triparma laevis f. inornata TaxID=1714386 RepID=A0A9W7DTW5_9STRA|nr:hypothetical protein TL16_g02062 [Triparma laevis f. inornata]
MFKMFKKEASEQDSNSFFSRKIFVMGGNRHNNDEKTISGGTMIRTADRHKNEMTKLKVYGLDAFQVRAEEEMKEMQRTKKDSFLARKLMAHDPTSSTRRWWDLISIIVILVSVFAAMFEFAFTVSLELEGSSKLMIGMFHSSYGAITLFFWLDLVYNFFTAFYNDEGELEFNHYEIAINYFKSYFLIDLVSNLPLSGPWGLLKAFRMHRMSRVLTRWSYLGYDPMKLQVFKLIVLIMTIGHFLACAFFMVSKFDYDQFRKKENLELETYDNKSWVVVDADGNQADIMNWIILDADIDPMLLETMEDKPVSSDVLSAYLTSMYFAYSTLTTVGYGDISAHTDVERSIAIISLISGSVIYAVLVGFINNLVDNSDVKETEYQARLAAINAFMSNHHLPADLRGRVRRYMELDHNAAHHDIKLLEYLSPMLQREAVMHMNRHFVQEVPFLADADSIFVWCILERMIVIVCVQKEYILVEGQAIEAMHIIKSGKVDVVDKSGQVIRTYTQGSFFGELCAQHDKHFAHDSFRAQVDMELCLISQPDLKMLMEAFPTFKETLDVITSARQMHEKKETDAYEEKMKKMMRQTGMKARPVTPPPGKEWEAKRGTGKGAGKKKDPRSESPAHRALLEHLDSDIKEFERSAKRLDEIRNSRSSRMELQMIKGKHVDKSPVPDASKLRRSVVAQQQEDESNSSDGDEEDDEVGETEIEKIMAKSRRASTEVSGGLKKIDSGNSGDDSGGKRKEKNSREFRNSFEGENAVGRAMHQLQRKSVIGFGNAHSISHAQRALGGNGGGNGGGQSAEMSTLIEGQRDQNELMAKMIRKLEFLEEKIENVAKADDKPRRKSMKDVDMNNLEAGG